MQHKMKSLHARTASQAPSIFLAILTSIITCLIQRAVWSRGQGLHFQSVRFGVRIPTALLPAWVALRGTLGAGNEYPNVADTPLLVIPQGGPALKVIFSSFIISFSICFNMGVGQSWVISRDRERESEN